MWYNMYNGKKYNNCSKNCSKQRHVVWHELNHTVWIGFISLIKNFSEIRQSNLFWHFLKIWKLCGLLAPYRAALWGGFQLLILCVLQCIGVANIACITQATLKWIHHILLTHKRQLVFPDLSSFTFLLVWTGLVSALIFWQKSARSLCTMFATWFWLGPVFIQPLGFVNPRTLLTQWICEWLTAQGCQYLGSNHSW